VYGLIKSTTEVFDIADVSAISSVSNTEIVLNSALTGAVADDDLWMERKLNQLECLLCTVLELVCTTLCYFVVSTELVNTRWHP